LIGDEAWELDYYLHENPREKRVPYAWLCSSASRTTSSASASVRTCR
jgi:hypothetical protein